MAELHNVPPGRAGRLWLGSRLRAARLAAELLQRKLVLLNIEQRRLEQALTASASRWRQADLAADRCLARASFLATPWEATLSAPTDQAVVTVEWSNLMGARYPTRAQVQVPAVAAGGRTPGSPALLAATAAAADALRAAADHAVIIAALRGHDRVGCHPAPVAGDHAPVDTSAGAGQHRAGPAVGRSRAGGVVPAPPHRRAVMISNQAG
jgi:hypothetical protein